MAETTLNIQITLDDEQLKSLITNNIQDLPKAKLQDILLQGLNDYIKTDGKSMFFTSNKYTTDLQNWVESVFKSCIKDIAKDNEEMLINTIHEFLGKHFKTILENSFTDVISLIFKNALNTEYIKQNVINIMNNMNRNQY
mgnify:CR=1 FL=1